MNLIKISIIISSCFFNSNLLPSAAPEDQAKPSLFQTRQPTAQPDSQPTAQAASQPTAQPDSQKFWIMSSRLVLIRRGTSHQSYSERIKDCLGGVAVQCDKDGNPCFDDTINVPRYARFTATGEIRRVRVAFVREYTGGPGQTRQILTY